MKLLRLFASVVVLLTVIFGTQSTRAKTRKPGARPASPLAKSTAMTTSSAAVDEAYRLVLGIGCRQSISEANTTLRKAASAGDPLAQLAQGLFMKFGGMGFKLEPDAARELIQRGQPAAVKAAELGNPTAKYLLARLYNGHLLQVSDRTSQSQALLAESAESSCPVAVLRMGYNAYDKEDFAAAEMWFERAKQLGCADAYSRLGRIYDRPGTPQFDCEKVRGYFQAGADAGSLDGQLCRGATYIMGLCQKVDIERGLKDVQAAVDGGSVGALEYLADLYTTPVLGIDYKKADEYWRRAAELGSEDSMVSLGRAYIEGLGVTTNTARGLNLIKSAAELDSQFAARKLGYLYCANEYGIKKNLKAARKWYEVAVTEGSGDAAFDLAEMLKYEFDDKETTRIADLFEFAAEHGVAGAMGYTGWAYQQGKGKSVNLWTAARWYQKGMKAGDAYSAGMLGWMYNEGEGLRKNYSRALSAFRRGVELGDSFSMVALAYKYLEGEDLEQDSLKAAELYRRAADLDDDEGMAGMGYISYYGYGVPRDQKQSERWYRKAAELGNEEAIDWLKEHRKASRTKK